MVEGPLTMVCHGALIAVVLYLLMRYLLGQSNAKSLNRSVLLGLLSAAYMIVFGHRLPNRVNHNL